VVEFAWRLPLPKKIHDGRGKWPLRRLLRRYVPEQLAERAKHGFNVPIGEWLRGPLRPWAEDTLSEASLLRHGLLDVAQVRNCLSRHLSGVRDHAHTLWAILMVQSWLDVSQEAIAVSEAEVMSNKGYELAAATQSSTVS
jgi:asparagine synthase (glutamine-hydrolysing)